MLLGKRNVVNFSNDAQDFVAQGVQYFFADDASYQQAWKEAKAAGIKPGAYDNCVPYIVLEREDAGKVASLPAHAGPRPIPRRPAASQGGSDTLYHG